MSDGLARYGLKKGLVGYWPFNENVVAYTNAADEIKDLSPTGAHGTTAGAPVTTTGIRGNAYVEGSGDDVNFGNEAALQINGNLSISHWLHLTTSVGVGRLILHNTGANAAKNFATHTNVGVLEYIHGNNVATSETLSSTVNIADSVWHHVVIVSIHPALYFYIDGVLVKTETTTFDNVANTADKKLCHTAWSVAFPGYIDELAVWNRGITADEVKAVYNGGLAKELGYKTIVNTPVGGVIVHENIVEEL